MSRENGRVESEQDFLDKTTSEILLFLAYCSIQADLPKGIQYILRKNLKELQQAKEQGG